MIRFPFWLLTPVSTPPQPSESPRADSRLPVAFSSYDRMSKYLSARTQTQWSVRLVNRYSVVEVIGELRKQGLSTICYEASGDGRGGTKVSVDEVVAIKDE